MATANASAIHRRMTLGQAVNRLLQHRSKRPIVTLERNGFAVVRLRRRLPKVTAVEAPYHCRRRTDDRSRDRPYALERLPNEVGEALGERYRSAEAFALHRDEDCFSARLPPTPSGKPRFPDLVIG